MNHLWPHFNPTAPEAEWSQDPSPQKTYSHFLVWTMMASGNWCRLWNRCKLTAILQTALPALYPHTLNLSSQAGLKVSRVSLIYARVRHVALFFSPQVNCHFCVDVQAANVKFSFRETHRRCGSTLEKLTGRAWALLGGSCCSFADYCRQTECTWNRHFGQCRHRRCQGQNSIHLWKMPPLCCRSLLCCSNIWYKTAWQDGMEAQIPSHKWRQPFWMTKEASTRGMQWTFCKRAVLWTCSSVPCPTWMILKGKK